MSDKAFAAESFVADSRSQDVAVGAAAGEPGRRRFSDHRVTTKPLHSGLTRVESLAKGKEPGVAVAIG